ncbi:glucose-6-phosphate dehydrogenase [Microbacterium oleivorans]|uniref:glucose-6-phosphate dehydrogenase n=1 Tax=Microbacterium oleivorans TaxID=273677 RepID=UPI0010A49C42|nr:glucose-6-phosphate dehydrogenase [Microbacterium oleivorans]THE08163.1 glucose-6-phosphate dehydrogenase [Microbacterium oleivorans]
MKITRSSDWRDALPFEVPVLAAEAVPGEPTRCVSCPAGSEPLERTELWAVKHRHPNNHAGFVRYYCAEHSPKTPPPPPASVASPGRARGAAPKARPERTVAPKRPGPSLDVVRAMCPDCFVEVSATGECGMCGQQVA